ncbi:hypothetical protein KSS87_010750 [Heliosperma pusillum]|nr:hypothetical protein KSS87_010750 [Heliosperma pusillum]
MGSIWLLWKAVTLAGHGMLLRLHLWLLYSRRM